MEDVRRIEVTLPANTQHVVLSELECPPSCPIDLGWRTEIEQDLPALIETVRELLQRDLPQRLSLPVLQIFVGITGKGELEEAVCKLLSMAVGTQHIIAIPTFRYSPGLFLYWDQIADLNKLVWEKSIAGGVPVLNLHKSYLCKQGREWTAAGSVYEEFCSGTGLGITLTSSGIQRYISRLSRFHMSGFAHESPVTMPAECRPIELNNTFVFTENPDTAEFLSGLGYKLLTRAEGKALRKKELAKAKSVDVAVAMEVEPEVVSGSVVAAKPEVKPKRLQKAKGKRPKGANTAFVSRPSHYDLISIDRVTFRDLIKTNGDLRSDLQKVGKVLVKNDEKIKRLEHECENFERVAIVAKARAREVKRLLAKSGEEAMEDQRDWRDLKEDLEGVIRDLEWEKEDWGVERQRLVEKIDKGCEALQKEQERVRDLQIKMDAWEDFVRRQGGQ